MDLSRAGVQIGNEPAMPLEKLIRIGDEISNILGKDIDGGTRKRARGKKIMMKVFVSDTHPASKDNPLEYGVKYYIIRGHRVAEVGEANYTSRDLK